ncbi:helix-turn-helix transcriptional regulator [Alteromonas gracilis]|uniref:helix-turn-helix transcriptional regulator n=1 Tax=Alteromonas gracilis TaxID=1479524 RepID=UPI0030D1E6FD
MKYLTQWRLRCASNDLKSTAAPIITIANKYGYESEASFSKAFKREMGVSPSKHR